jgi:HSP20 family protein
VSEGRSRDPFAELYGDFADRLQGDRWRPDVDVYETEADVVVRAEIAGVASRSLRVAVDGQVLRISGVREAPEAGEVLRLHQVEIASGPFERRIPIPVGIDRDRVVAHLADGFLTVSLPKRRPRRVRVEAGE